MDQQVNTPASTQTSAPRAAEPERVRDPASRRLALMVVLTFVTGVVDAAGYIGLDHTFLGNMTGNIVLVGLALTGHGMAAPIGPVVALVAFTVGAFVAGLVLHRSDRTWNRRVTALLVTGAVLVALVGVWLLLTPTLSDASPAGIAASAVIALQMGSQALIARHLSVKDMTTVVVTSTLTSWAGESLFTRQHRVVNRRSVAILALVLGAIAGGALIHLGLWVPVLLTAVLTLAVVLVGARRWEA